jgi:hypothetical protein
MKRMAALRRGFEFVEIGGVKAGFEILRWNDWPL